jgi:antirestriction protein ArdC
MSEDRFSRRDVYELVTSRILAALEKGVVPWHQPWTTQPPSNLVTKKAYRGVNVFLLSIQPHASPWWATYRQIETLHGHVRRGEHGTPVVFWKIMDKEDQEEQQERTFPLLRHYTVFNAEQCQGIERHLPPTKEAPAEPIAAAEAIVRDMPDPPTIRRGLQAAYSPLVDEVMIPTLPDFESAEAYHSTLFHELAHSTGHSRRLDRPTLTEACPFGSTNYSKEELVAEMAAAFLCGYAGISNTTVDNSAAYLAQWCERLSEDRKLLVQAATAAQKAADYVIGVVSS